MTLEARTACEIIQKAKQLSLVVHERPDGDAIGSAAALFHHWNKKKDVEIVSVSTIPSIFFPAVGECVVSNRPTKSCIVILDCAQIHRTGMEKTLSSAKDRGATVVAFDHHKRSTIGRFADAAVHDPEASSTTEIIFDCLESFRQPISPQVAQSLLLGIVTDTHFFQHPNTTSRTLRAASRLIRFGADLGALQAAFDEHRTISKTKLWGDALSGLRLEENGLAVTKITATTLRKHGASEKDVAGLANAIALLDEARAAAVLVETRDGWRATLRTRHGDVDLRRLARFFEGRGIQKATGFFATNEAVSGKISAT